ncbi:alkaline phosphatase [Psychroserpens luteolus]|uniref:alkaline phosphatase n=1 Tax=Psychroserpens luteolus TaxID=2855840 RepID=UPI001E47D9D6|nr:alkaline phosphatase [Psychroserpens luteolus]MCD2259518.1 alkaline phosphatase [Psychroserpens luteolus]
MTHKSIIYLILSLLLFNCKTNDVVKKETSTKAKNVILLIGDGTGLSQISSAFYFKETSPNYARFKTIGLIKTSSSRQDVTDSAAGATAFASGVKTYNGAIGVADDSTEVKTLVEIVSPQNIKTGVISTSSIQHATPASFYAHAINRGLYEDIAADMVASDIDFFAGGGTRFFNERKDGKNLLEDLKAKGFGINTTALDDFSGIKDYSKMAYLLAKTHMDSIGGNGRGDFLPKATELGMQFLSKDPDYPNFFIMIEGSQIDWGGHANDASYLIAELIDFDNAIGKALDFAEKDGNTLVIVTADHETGGFTLSASTKTREDGSTYSDYSEVAGTFSTKGHSATLIPVFAYGPGSEAFAGIYENTEIFHKILEATNWTNKN